MNLNKFADLSMTDCCEIRRNQEKLLRSHIENLMRTSQFYQHHLRDINLQNISIDSLTSLPLTSKTDFEEYNQQFIACDPESIVDIVHSSGTSGSPTYVAYSENDLQRLEYNEVQALKHCGIRKSDTVLLTCTVDRCFIAGLAYFLGCRGIGAASIRNGANTLESHLRIIHDLKPTAIIGVPSFLLKLAKFAEANGLKPQTAGIDKLVCIGEPLRDYSHDSGKISTTSLGLKIEEMWGAKAFSTYASTETVTTFCECEAQQGGHLIPELGIVEIIDEKDRILPPGEIGEIVMTPFHTKGMPLLRYRTGDMACIIDEPCICGRKSVRITPIIGRKYQMIKYCGTKFYPPAVYAVLDSLESVKLYQLQVRKDKLSDHVTLLLSMLDNADLSCVKNALQTALRVNIDIEIQNSKQLAEKVFPDGSRKPVKYVEM